jgi:hypothetical protein
MSFRDEAALIQRDLRKLKIASIVPVPEDEEKATLTPEQFRVFVGIVAFRYLRKIAANSRSTKAILIVNPPKKGIKGYVGPSTFAEASVAFAHRKPIFTLHDLAPETGLDEAHHHIMGFSELLRIWQAQSLQGNLQPLIDLFSNSIGGKRRSPRHKRNRGYR